MSETTVLYIVLAIIVVVAILWARSGVKLKLPGGIEASVDKPAEKKTVSVADNISMEGVEAGNVTGQRGAAGDASDVRVMNNAVIRGGKIVDITGVDTTAEKK